MMRRLFVLVVLLFSPVILAGAQPAEPYRVFLLGDAGGFDPYSPQPLLEHLRGRMEDAGDRSALVLLGDNLYPAGLPDSSSDRRTFSEDRLRQLLGIADDYQGRVVVIPGNHDWGDSGPDGAEAVGRQERFVEDVLDRGNTFLPDDGLPGPETVELTDHVTLVAIDTEWWLRADAKPFGDGGRYETYEEADLIANLADVLRRKDDDHLLVVGHHPLRSNGPHAGRMSFRTHVFPLTSLWSNAWIPLPGLGSLYPLAVAWIGGRQDLAHWKYRSLTNALGRLFASHEQSLVYASGHEHSLQHFPEDNVHYVVSGSSSRPGYVAAGRGAAFASSESGFMEVRYETDGSVWLTAWTVDGVLYESRIAEPSASGGDLPLGLDDSPTIAGDSLYLGAAAAGLAAGRLKRWVLGAHHRDAWTTPVTVPVFDASTVAGGLTAEKRGGGLQTVSLRLESEDGRQFVLRSLTKNPVGTLPSVLQETVAGDVTLDQVSILHPYASVAIPVLAEAAGVYHTVPEIYFVPPQPELGPYRQSVGNRLMLFEERPDEDMSHAPHFGRSEDVVGAASMLSQVTEDNDNRVDQPFFARARLFDMLISDWDRHHDQWRWASFDSEDGDGTVFRAIPRDRDWAFNRMNGLFPSILQSRMVMPKFQEFAPEFGFIPGLNLNGMPQDRRFTSALDESDWVAIAESIQQAISPAVANRAFARLPEPVRSQEADGMAATLLSRLEQLPDAARTYSRHLDRYVDVVGSNRHERFRVLAVGDDSTRVIVTKTSSKGEDRRVIYDRTFSRARTSEIRLYGLHGSDRFEVDGIARGMDVYVIAGAGTDSFVDRGASGLRHGTVYVYDTEEGISIEPGDHTRVRLSPDPEVNRYDRYDFRYPWLMPRAFFGANDDDGIFVGGGVTYFQHAFRRLPYAGRHTVMANVAGRTGAFNIMASSEVTSALGSWDANLDGRVRSRNSIQNFFGLGNETVQTDSSRTFYEARLATASVRLLAQRRLPRQSMFRLGPTLRFVRVREEENRFVGVPQAGVSPTTFDDQWHIGLRGELILDDRDDDAYPRRGFRWATGIEVLRGLTGSSAHYTRISSTLATYVTPRHDGATTAALRVGFRRSAGPFPFYDSATIGGLDNLRGWRSTRFAGRTAVFHNTELRVRLHRFSSFLAAGSYGLFGFVDGGRVWTDGEHSREWHFGHGGGVWLNLFGATVISTGIGRSREEQIATLSFGFLF